MAKANKQQIAYERLKQVAIYDPETGILSRRERQRGPVPLPKAENRYVTFSVDGIDYQAHVLVWLYMTGEWPPGLLDHKDMDRRNNRWDNLRLATKSQNGANAAQKKNNKSGFKNVFKETWSGKWKASLTVNRKLISLGRYDCPAAAYFAAVVGADKHFGEFARAA